MTRDILFTEAEIQAKVKELGAQITKDYQGESILLVGILKGSVPFIADLMRAIDLDVSVDYMQVSSYGANTKSSGVVKIIKDLDADITGKNVIIVEDIVDTGITLNYLKSYLAGRQCKSLKICSILNKPSKRKVDLDPDYKGFDIDDLFIIGYGLDLDQKYRNLPYISYFQEDEDD